MPVATKKLRSNRAWIERHINDPFVKRSRAEGYRARSVYKLTELDDREHLLRRGINVVELGAAPGSWTQVVRERLVDRNGNIDGRIIAMDILPMDPIDGVTFLQGDFREQEIADKLSEAADALLSAFDSTSLILFSCASIDDTLSLVDLIISRI